MPRAMCRGLLMLPGKMRRHVADIHLRPEPEGDQDPMKVGKSMGCSLGEDALLLAAPCSSAMALDPAEALEETESLVQTRYAVQRLREMATTFLLLVPPTPTPKGLQQAEEQREALTRELRCREEERVRKEQRGADAQCLGGGWGEQVEESQSVEQLKAKQVLMALELAIKVAGEAAAAAERAADFEGKGRLHDGHRKAEETHGNLPELRRRQSFSATLGGGLWLGSSLLPREWSKGDGNFDGGYAGGCLCWVLVVLVAWGYHEDEVGEAIQSLRREDIFLQSKIHPQDLGYVSTQRAFQESLQRLKTSYLDSMLLHKPWCWPGACSREPEGTWQESWRALEELHTSQLALAIGICDVDAALLLQLLQQRQKPHIVQNWCLGVGYDQQNPVLLHPVLRSIAVFHGRTVVLNWALGQGVSVLPASTDEARQRMWRPLMPLEWPLALDGTLDDVEPSTAIMTGAAWRERHRCRRVLGHAMPCVYHASLTKNRSSIRRDGLRKQPARHGHPYVYGTFKCGQAQRIGQNRWGDAFDIWMMKVEQSEILTDVHPPWCGMTDFQEVLLDSIGPERLMLVYTPEGAFLNRLCKWLFCGILVLVPLGVAYWVLPDHTKPVTHSLMQRSKQMAHTVMTGLYQATLGMGQMAHSSLRIAQYGMTEAYKAILAMGPAVEHGKQMAHTAMTGLWQVMVGTGQMAHSSLQIAQYGMAEAYKAILAIGPTVEYGKQMAHTAMTGLRQVMVGMGQVAHSSLQIAQYGMAEAYKAILAMGPAVEHGKQMAHTAMTRLWQVMVGMEQMAHSSLQIAQYGTAEACKAILAMGPTVEHGKQMAHTAMTGLWQVMVGMGQVAHSSLQIAQHGMAEAYKAILAMGPAVEHGKQMAHTAMTGLWQVMVGMEQMAHSSLQIAQYGMAEAYKAILAMGPAVEHGKQMAHTAMTGLWQVMVGMEQMAHSSMQIAQYGMAEAYKAILAMGPSVEHGKQMAHTAMTGLWQVMVGMGQVAHSSMQIAQHGVAEAYKAILAMGPAVEHGKQMAHTAMTGLWQVMVGMGQVAHSSMQIAQHGMAEAYKAILAMGPWVEYSKHMVLVILARFYQLALGIGQLAEYSMGLSQSGMARVYAGMFAKGSFVAHFMRSLSL
eukprot:Skav226347  [mRNA]  locus=scaffold2980:193417:217245:- [translate_table: standard]